MQGDERLIRDVQSLVQAPEEVLGAVLGIGGPRPGSEVLVLLPYPLLLMATDNHVLAVAVSALVFVAIQVLRRYTIVVRTDRQVLVVHNGRRRRLHEPAAPERFGLDAMRLDPAGRNIISVGGHTFWLTGPHVDEARRLASLPTR
jgi:hypothetical protein